MFAGIKFSTCYLLGLFYTDLESPYILVDIAYLDSYEKLLACTIKQG